MTIDQILQQEIDESNKWLDREQDESVYKRVLKKRIELLNWVLENMKKPDAKICDLIESRMNNIVLTLYTACIDTVHGEPYHATLPNNKIVAISTMTMFTGTPVKVTDTPLSTGSLQFTGSALVFHKTSGEPFTVTHTLMPLQGHQIITRSLDQDY
jgi:hypothetical protein